MDTLPETGESQTVVQQKLFQTEDSKSSTLDKISSEQIALNLFSINSIPGIGIKKLGNLYDLGIVQEFHRLSKGELASRLNNSTPRIAKLIMEETATGTEKLISKGKRYFERLANRDIRLILNTDELFPNSLRNIESPPRWFFSTGNDEILKSNHTVGIIGSRNASEFGKSVAKELAKQLVKRNVVVISGLAEGIDESAHKGAVGSFGQTLAVLGHGFESRGTNINQKLWSDIIATDGALISEYFPDDRPSRDSYLRRNSIIAALSKVIIPVESPSLRSGTGSTIRRAIKMGVPVIGLDVADTAVEKLIETQKSLARANIQTYPFSFQNNQEFFMHLQKILGIKKYDLSSAKRKERFLRLIAKYFWRYKKTLDLTSADIDQLYSMLKKDT